MIPRTASAISSYPAPINVVAGYDGWPLIDVVAKVKPGTADEQEGLGTGEYDYTAQVDLRKNFGPTVAFGTVRFSYNEGRHILLPMDSTKKQDLTSKLGLAAVAAKQGDYEQAIAQLKDLLAIDARHEVALGMIAAIYAQLGMRDRAVDYYGKALAINSGNTLARFQLGLVQLTDQQPPQALATWKPCLNDETNFMVRFHSGLALLQLGRESEAREMFEAADVHMPRSHPLQEQLQQFRTMLNPK